MKRPSSAFQKKARLHVLKVSPHMSSPSCEASAGWNSKGAEAKSGRLQTAAPSFAHSGSSLWLSRSPCPHAVELPYSFRALSQVTWHVFPLVTMEWKLLLSVVASLILSDHAHRSLCPRRSNSSFFTSMHRIFAFQTFRR